jgi:CRISPR system Cascade subunit CasA
MPRRIRLDFTPAEGEICDLTGAVGSNLAQTYRTRPHGTNYSEGFEHPLSPHYRDKKSQALFPVHPQPGGIGYRHWLGFVAADQDTDRRPAQCIRHFRDLRAYDLDDQVFHVAAFGYDMDNMKARAWIESAMPVAMTGDASARARLDDTARRFVQAARDVSNALTQRVKQAQFKEPAAIRGDLSLIQKRFWQATDADFFELSAEAAERADEDALPELRAGWLDVMRNAALEIFDTTVPSLGFEQGAMERIVTARFGLVMTLAGRNPAGRKMFEKLRLLPPEKRAK